MKNYTYKELKNHILDLNNNYYNLYTSKVSDKEYDKLYALLEKFELEQGFSDSDSPTRTVGGKAGKIAHPFPLYSLKKVYTSEEIDEEFSIETPKIDGTNLSLIYKYGRLRQALTRGNGKFGDNIIHLGRLIENVPKKIQIANMDLIVVNGECVTNNKVDNFRNYVSGSLALKSEKEFKNRNIQFIAHDWLGEISLDYTERLDALQSAGFITVFNSITQNYPQDGLVYRINNYKRCNDLGYTSKYPRFAVALKEEKKITGITILQNVEWNIGRTGTVNPTGIVDPITLDDAEITRVTLHNIDIIESNNLGLGDKIEIERAGGVIPKFLRVVESSNHNIKITQDHANSSIGKKTARHGPRLILPNFNEVNEKAIEHFVKVMEIKGLGPASIKKLQIKHITDIYSDKVNWSDLGANGIKVQEEIELSKEKDYSTVLAALGIPSVGKSTAENIVKVIPEFHRLEEIETTTVTKVGPKTISQILIWLKENKNWVEKLPLNFEQKLTAFSVSNKRVCVTGTLDMPRKRLFSILEEKGYRPITDVTKNCYALITDGKSVGNKHEKAVKYNIPIYNYWDNKDIILNGQL